ncbi:MAG TPA: flagellar hook assembly protein FlgD [Gammaproteobacteria bacterium]|nr:flagellar hook assembly protein FlgD [Gammaproteobacteria bacterium]
MSIDNTTGVSWESLGLNRPEEKGRKEDVGQEQFLELMLAQLQNQDPLQPMENGEFLSQMAQFSSAKGIQEMSLSLESFTQSLTSSQALQASSLIGRQVLVPGEIAWLEEGSGGISGAARLPGGASDVVLSVYDASGALVQRISYGPQEAGQFRFSWDGTGSDGQPVAPGHYRIGVEMRSGEESRAAETMLVSRVESVTLGKGGQGVTLNLAGLGSASMSEVREIM